MESFGFVGRLSGSSELDRLGLNIWRKRILNSVLLSEWMEGRRLDKRWEFIGFVYSLNDRIYPQTFRHMNNESNTK